MSGPLSLLASRIAEALLNAGLIAAEEKVMMGCMGQLSLPLVLAPDAAFAIGVPVRTRDRPFPRITASLSRDDTAAFGAGMMCFQRYLL